jgi:hypothetical protein
MPLNSPIAGMAATPDGNGYWLVAKDGGIFSFGSAGFFGSLGGSGTTNVIGITTTVEGLGYWIITSDGRLSPFGDAANYGSGPSLNSPAVGLAAIK